MECHGPGALDRGPALEGTGVRSYEVLLRGRLCRCDLIGGDSRGECGALRPERTVRRTSGYQDVVEPVASHSCALQGWAAVQGARPVALHDLEASLASPVHVLVRRQPPQGA